MKITEYDKCTGCAACYSVCPEKCISMKENQEGFLYPEVNEDLCIKCGMCRKTCPVNRAHFKELSDMPETYLSRSRNESIRRCSASGGVFTQIAKNFLSEGNSIVYGCVYGENFEVCHAAVSDTDNVEKLSRSKYVQSRIGDIYKDVRQKLLEGKRVLFSGTACQIYGLHSFLGKEYDALYCIDVVCYGVPSPKVYFKYLRWVSEKNGQIDKVVMRDKQIYKKFYRACYAIDLKNGKKYMKLTADDPFALSFFRNLSIRRSCYECHFKTVHRISDITIGDCWFSENLSELEDVDGVTLTIVHSEKGKQLMESGNIESVTVNSEKAIKANGGKIYSCAVKNPERDEFFRDIECMEFDDVVKKYLKPDKSVRMWLTNVLKNNGLIPQFLIDRKQEKEFRRRISQTIPKESFGRMEL